MEIYFFHNSQCRYEINYGEIEWKLCVNWLTKMRIHILCQHFQLTFSTSRVNSIEIIFFYLFFFSPSGKLSNQLQFNYQLPPLELWQNHVESFSILKKKKIVVETWKSHDEIRVFLPLRFLRFLVIPLDDFYWNSLMLTWQIQLIRKFSWLEWQFINYFHC